MSLTGPFVAAPARPALAMPPRPALRRGLWAGPLALSLVFVAAVLAWLARAEEAEREDQSQELITDALSLQSRIGARVDDEDRLLRSLAIRLEPMPAAGPTGGAQAFATAPEVQIGLRRYWVSLTWLDAANRIVAHLPEQSPPLEPSQWRDPARGGLTTHLAAPVAGGGTLVARYSPNDLLRQNLPWWLARKYDVRLVDGFGEVIASTAEGRELPDRQSHRIAMDPTIPDSMLELIARDRVTPWHRSFPMAMVAGFVLLIGAMTEMLRRQVADVSRAEAAWRHEAAWRSAMEDSLTVGLRARDFDGRLLYVNRTLADMIGYAPEALVGLAPPMPYWPPDSLDEILERHARNMKGEAPRGGYEARWQHRDGRRLDVMVFEAPLVDAAGRHVGWMGSILDITERKRLEERERRQAETMTHHARLTMLGEVASALAHELNQPLTAISSYTAGVLNSLRRPAAPAPADPVVLRALERLGEQAAHAGRIVQRIRAFLTRRAPQREPASLDAIVEGGVALLARELERQRVRLAVSLAAALPDTYADAVLIEQVVINLVRNAADALAELPADDGRERRIEVRTVSAADGRSLCVVVEDNGPGLAGQRIETLCAPFHSTKKEGMGMGLAICRSIIEAHQGALGAVDRPEGGARFTLTLPVDRRAARRPPERAVEPETGA